MAPSRAFLLASALAALTAPRGTGAFSPAEIGAVAGSGGGRRRVRLTSYSGDFEGEAVGGDENGADLAKDFYDHLRVRDERVTPGDGAEEYRRLKEQQQRRQQREDRGDGKGDDDDEREEETYELLPEDEARRRNRDPFGNRREVRMGKYDIPSPLSSRDKKSSRGGGGKKFTGGGGGTSPDPPLDSTGVPSAGLFSGRGSSVFSFPAERVKGDGSPPERLSPDDPRARMMRNEFNLVSRAGSEVSIAAQAAVVLLFLGFAVYVGATGGITDGSERFFMEAEIDPMGAEAILQEGMAGGATVEDWVGTSPPAPGGSVWL